GPHVSDESLFGSPSAPTRSSDLLRFWGEDFIGGGDRIAKQFWGDIFAKLLHVNRNGIDGSISAGVRRSKTVHSRISANFDNGRCARPIGGNNRTAGRKIFPLREGNTMIRWGWRLAA